MHATQSASLPQFPSLSSFPRPNQAKNTRLVVQLLLGTFGCPVRCLFCRCLPVHRVERDEFLCHQPLFHPITSFVRLVGCVLSYTCSLNSNAWDKFSVEVTADDQHVPRGLGDFLDHVVCLLNMVVCISTVWHVHTHQGDTLRVDSDRGCSGTFADVVCPVSCAFTSCSQQWRLRACSRISQHTFASPIFPLFQASMSPRPTSRPIFILAVR